MIRAAFYVYSTALELDVAMGRQQDPPTDPCEYDKLGLGALPSSATPQELYIDIVKRAVANILYEDPPAFFYDCTNEPVIAKRFELSRRVLGEDAPPLAHTMIGIRRLDNVAKCVEEIVKNGIQGDVVEAGVLRGGAAIFLAACLRAHGLLERRVFVCDTFQQHATIPFLTALLLQAIAYCPGLAWKRRLLVWGQSRMKTRSFPDVRNPSDELTRFVMWTLKHPRLLRNFKRGGFDEVKSNFAKYGLLTDRIVFLKGLFSDTLPTAPMSKLALARLDGDTYESTRDALVNLYPRLSTGGYCIIDDYNSFSDCKLAVNEYREQNRINDKIVEIDNLAVYWKKS
jgi:Macrocin-O-methyltransferase (TylF)